MCGVLKQREIMSLNKAGQHWELLLFGSDVTNVSSSRCITGVNIWIWSAELDVSISICIHVFRLEQGILVSVSSKLVLGLLEPCCEPCCEHWPGSHWVKMGEGSQHLNKSWVGPCLTC